MRFKVSSANNKMDKYKHLLEKEVKNVTEVIDWVNSNPRKDLKRSIEILRDKFISGRVLDDNSGHEYTFRDESYFIEINSIEELMNFIEEVNERVIINGDDDSIEIYNYCIE